jgi:tripartite ATP-independent transporter DctP family solute receptor
MSSLMNWPVSRRMLLATAAAVPIAAPAIVRAAAAQFTYKFATGQDPTHPLNIRLGEAFGRIREKTGGALDIKLFPANQLGTETDVLSQIRLGSLEFLILSASILATLVPVAGIANTAYAFGDYDAVWKAMDGPLGDYTRGRIESTGLVAFGRIWDNGFRQVTSSSRQIKTPEDMKGFKIRVPPAPMLTSFFTAIGASPTPMNFAEVYSALQTRLIDGQENGLSLIATTRLYEVQKYCALTGHSWDGYWPLANRKAWERLPQAMRDMAAGEIDQSARDERIDIAVKDSSLRGFLTDKGLTISDVDKITFRYALAQTSYYRDWKDKYGEEAWTQLETACGKLT